MEVLAVLSILLVYLLLTINKGIPAEKKKAEADSVIEIGNNCFFKTCLLSSELDLALKSKDSLVCKIGNNFMKARGLLKDDFVIAHNIRRHRTSLKKGDLILIKIKEDGNNRSNKLTIREFVGQLDNGKIQTIHYHNYAPVKTEHHTVKDIIAVIDNHIKSDRLIGNLSFCN